VVERGRLVTVEEKDVAAAAAAANRRLMKRAGVRR
jgi:hypothetical protein